MHPVYGYIFDKFIKWLKHSFSYLWLVAFAIYLAFSAGQSVYKTYQANQETEALREKLSKTLLEKQRLDALLVYYQTDTFKEYEMRRAMLLKNPNEKVYALPEQSESGSIVDGVEMALVQEQKKEVEDKKQQANWRQWYEFVVR